MKKLKIPALLNEARLEDEEITVVCDCWNILILDVCLN